MALVDFGRVVLGLKERVAAHPEKGSWGRRELLEAIAELEVEHALEESEIRRVMRVAEDEVEDLLFFRAVRPDRQPGGTGQGAPASHAEAAGHGAMHEPPDRLEGDEPPKGAPCQERAAASSAVAAATA